ncbi:glycosyltransferase involved in cell wall biosynthesis [Luteibacter rhizovicinus]|uniref:Glycosyltransferase involved in cell wall biosynthesis n=1 Tax=Luteibacter rhizovicinus TaxID=242606 RepID=A0A4R3YLB2_9GAMM|nr:glycosyltransferase family 4 protein [Luteibacter rhizovicinus]TCV93357.1 glycosyltransferase involved in cell wall biosynthesis [Luteibacter rhizovicinus]
MKFLFVGTNQENTGASTHFVTLAQAMEEAGHQVGVMTCPGGLIAQELARSHVQVDNAMFRNAYDLRGYARVFAVAKRTKPDYLVGNFGKEYWPLIAIGRLLGIPVALFRHRIPPMKRLSAYLLPRLAHRFFAVSNYARQAYLDRGVPAERVHILYNPVNTTRYRPDRQQRSTILRTLGIDDEAIVLGYSGRMFAGKGIFVLLEAATKAMEREPRLHCLWLGDGPDLKALRDRVAALPTAHRHRFAGWIHDIAPYYSAMSMLAFPSLAPETFGRGSIEAQAAGIPVLCSNIGGLPETLLPGVTGLLLPPGDVDAWRDAILKTCEPSFRLPMGSAAREYMLARFSTIVIATQFVGILTDS